MSQQQKEFMEMIARVMWFLLKGAAGVAIVIIGFFAERWVRSAEDTRDSMIRMEVIINAMNKENEDNNRRIEKEIDEIRADIKSLSQKP